MGKFIAGIIAGILLVGLAGYSYIAMGYMPVAASSAPLPFEAWLAHSGLRAVLKTERNRPSPIQPSEENLRAGARIYMKNCAVCHGVPDEEETGIAEGMFPEPPQLFEQDDKVTDDPVGATFWKARNGIRLTGMPGFQGALTDDEIWQVTLLLKNADKLSPSVQKLLQAAPEK